MPESPTHAEFDQQLLSAMNVEARWFLRPGKPKTPVSIEELHVRVAEYMREATPELAQDIDLRSLVTRHACHIVLSEAMYLHQLPYTMRYIKGKETMEPHILKSRQRIQDHFQKISINRGFNVSTYLHPLFGHFKGSAGTNNEGREIWQFRDLPRSQAQLAGNLANTGTLLKTFDAHPELARLDPSVRIDAFFVSLRSKMFDLLKDAVFFTPELRQKAEQLVVDDWITSIAPMKKSIEAVGREWGFDDLFEDAGQLEKLIAKLDFAKLTAEDMKKLEHVFALASMQYVADSDKAALRKLTDIWVGKYLRDRDPACEHPYVGLAMFAACVQEESNDPGHVLDRT
jgi:hypothetical protein